MLYLFDCFRKQICFIDVTIFVYLDNLPTMTDKGARGRAAAVAAAADVSEQGNRNRPPMTTIVRSEQVEADLDRKIRQIRERNLLILNRQKVNFYLICSIKYNFFVCFDVCASR